MSKFKPILETPCLLLRPFTIDDFEAVHSWAGNPANTRYMAWEPNSQNETWEFLKIVTDAESA